MTIKLLIILAFVPSMLGITTQNDPTGKNFKALVGEDKSTKRKIVFSEE